MPDRIRFHLDEHLPRAVAEALRRNQIDVTTTHKAGLRGRPDAEHLEFIRTSGRVIVTHDADFLRIARSTTKHPGIAYSPKGALSVGEVIRRLILIHEVLSSKEMAGRVEFL